ncbi:MAG: hypothetical protein AAF585_28815 [Verrucomicrobiota bacterium]
MISKAHVVVSILLITLCRLASADDWEDLLQKPVNEEWKQVFGVGLNQLTVREAETFGDKIKAIQKLIADDHEGRTIPVIIDEKIASTEMARIPPTPDKEFRIGLDITRVPAIEVFQYVCELSRLKMTLEKAGIRISDLD